MRKMEIEYTLERQGKDWTVLDGKPMGGGGSPSDAGQAPTGGPDTSGSPLPQGHPPAN